MNTVDELISFHGGVSQQDITLRLPQQVEDSVNCFHSLEYGTRRRNPTEAIGQASGINSDCWTYEYDRGLTGSNEKYSFLYDENGFRVIDLNTGVNIPVIDNSGTYLEPFTSKTGYSAITIKDTTFISNRNKVSLLNEIDSSEEDLYNDYLDYAYIWIQRSDPVDGYDYEIKITKEDDSIEEYTISSELSTTDVATNLNYQLNGYIYNETSKEWEDDSYDMFVSYRSGNIVKFKSATSSRIKSIVVSDNYGNLAISSFFKKVSTEADLPSSIGFDDAIVEVGGENNYDKSYWLKSESSSWIETRYPNIQHSIDNTTMPHKITREIDGSGNVYFLIEPIEWNERLIGDDDNNETPSFIGTGISDIFFHANRLGFLTPNSILFSEVGEFYNFWRTTQVATLDSDRIDVEIESKKAIRLHFVEFLQNDMIIFGERTQYKIEYSGTLTSSTIYATPIMNYDISTSTRPLALGNKIFFIANNGSYNSMYAMEYTDDEIIRQAENVSKQVPKLLEGTIDEIVGSSINSMIVVKSNSYAKKLFIYKFLENDGKLIQSAWFTWTFNADIHSTFITNSELYLLTTRDGSVGNPDWTLGAGTWNDSGEWDDGELWNDSSNIAYDNIEKISLVPIDLDSDFRDNGETEYNSTFTLSQYLPRVNDTVRMSDKVNLKTIYVKSNEDSKFELDIKNKHRDISRTISQEYVIGRKPYILGKAKDTEISIASVGSDGFEINGVAIEARINNRSRSI